MFGVEVEQVGLVEPDGFMCVGMHGSCRTYLADLQPIVGIPLEGKLIFKALFLDFFFIIRLKDIEPWLMALIDAIHQPFLAIIRWNVAEFVFDKTVSDSFVDGMVDFPAISDNGCTFLSWGGLTEKIAMFGIIFCKWKLIM